MKTIPEKKVCRRCEIDKLIEEFRTRASGFVLNQCKSCENELSKLRRVKPLVPELVKVTTKSGKEIEASVKPILGGHKTISPNTDKVLYFAPEINRDMARVAFSSFANIPRTGIQFQSI